MQIAAPNMKLKDLRINLSPSWGPRPADRRNFTAIARPSVGTLQKVVQRLSKRPPGLSDYAQ